VRIKEEYREKTRRQTGDSGSSEPLADHEKNERRRCEYADRLEGQGGRCVPSDNLERSRNGDGNAEPWQRNANQKESATENSEDEVGAATAAPGDCDGIAE
jgi:hypothetical protein